MLKQEPVVIYHTHYITCSNQHHCIELCDQLARNVAAPKKDDPFLLAYSMTDCPLFTEEDCRERPDTIGGGRRKSRIGWPRRLRRGEFVVYCV